MFDLSIDLNALDTEWLEQPERFYDVATQAAEAKREVERTKLALDIAEAELDNDIRANPVKYGIAKITEGAISSAIKLAKPYQDAVNTHADAQLHNNHMQSGVQAFDQRKKALENLVEQVTPPPSLDIDTSVINEARAAIAAAKGEE